MRRLARSVLEMSLILFVQSTAARPVDRFYRAVRPLGMGGTAVATVNDETALLLNPAALTRLRDSFVTIVDPEIEADYNAFRINGASPTKMSSPKTALPALQKLQDHHYHQRAQIFPSMVFPGFGFGAFAKQEIDAAYTSDHPGEFPYDYTQDIAAVAGFGVRIFSGIVKVGATGRLDSRRAVRADNLDVTQSLQLADLAREGTGLGVDGALSVTAPVDLLPTLSLVYRDIGQTSYTLMKGLTHGTDARPLMSHDSLDVGLAISPIHQRNVRSTWSIEFDDALHAEDDVFRHVHAGLEINYGDAVFARAGVNQRYWTLGLECAFVNYQVQLATYGEDVGTVKHPREDRRAVAKISVRF